MAAIVSAAALLVRELLAAAARRNAVLAQSRRHRARNRLGQHDLLLREIDSLWRHNARLRSRESACQRRCRTLEGRVRSLESSCAQLRRRVEALTRLITPKPATLQTGDSLAR